MSRNHVNSGTKPRLTMPMQQFDAICRAAEILASGLKYYEHDGHDMPKAVAREALEALGVAREDQP